MRVFLLTGCTSNNTQTVLRVDGMTSQLKLINVTYTIMNSCFPRSFNTR